MRSSLLRGLILLSCGVMAGAQAQPLATMRAGQVAFHHWQDQGLAAVTQWMRNRQAPGSASVSEETQLWQSDMLMRFGLDREASELLTTASARGGSSAARDQAWFNLAQKLNQRGQSAEAESALSQVRGNLPAAQQDAGVLLKAQLLMARADYRAAVQVLSAQGESASFLVRYNLGVAQIRAGNEAQGAATLDALGKDAARTDEQKVLRDRANVALGFAALKAGQPAQARTYLERVPLQGSESNKALLGYGWAAMDQQNPQSALVPWLALSQRDPKDPAALEARLAVPYAYEQLGAKGKALQTYLDAVETFERERNSLDAAMAFCKGGRWLDGVLRANAAKPASSGANTDADVALPSDPPHWGYLASTVSQDAFQQGIRNLVDLDGLEASMAGNPSRLDELKAALAVRQQAFARHQDRLKALNSARVLADSRQRIAALTQEVGLAETRMDGVALADSKQRDMLASANRLVSLAQKPNASPELVQSRERVRMAANVLNWQLAQEAPARLDRAKQNLASAQDELKQAQTHADTIARLLREGPVAMDQWGNRIQALTQRLDANRRALKAWRAEQESALQAMALADLARQKDTLTAHLAQARFAVAKLYDEAVATRGENKEATNAPKP